MRLLLLLFLLVFVGCFNEAPTTAITYPEAGAETALLYLEKCGGCHLAPTPKSHPKKVWFTVVQRMQMRMLSKGMPQLDQQELKNILDYLQRNAGPAKE